MGMPLTVKGQGTIPKPIHDRLGLVPGASAVAFVLEADGRVTLRRADEARQPADRFARSKGKPPAGWTGLATEQVMRMTREDDWGDAG
jgi:bifunctional DNA-binding transcriptional regulator/antitoxin component of YhaV-PrlF toxin-antitoxin module